MNLVLANGGGGRSLPPSDPSLALTICSWRTTLMKAFGKHRITGLSLEEMQDVQQNLKREQMLAVLVSWKFKFS